MGCPRPLRLRCRGPPRYVGRIVDRDHLVDRRDLSIDRLNPGLQFLDLAEQLGALPLQFLVNSHLLPLRQKEPEATKEPGSDLVVFAT